MYVNDTKTFSSNEDPLQPLADIKMEVKGVKDWLRKNELSLNVAKCEYMFLGNNKQLSKLKLIESKLIKIKEKRGQNKYLGLTIDKSLSWNQ